MMMHRVPQPGRCWPAVGAPVDRRVRQRGGRMRAVAQFGELVGAEAMKAGLGEPTNVCSGDKACEALAVAAWCWKSSRLRHGSFVLPNVRANRRAEAGGLGPVGENVLRTADRALVACRWRSA